ncbi:MAG: T9SS type A sorting domain-containing protein [Flavobacteriales bacterium]|jgi:hypothetical protein|nr:T9SS type A sorting domain-containing protein [Flavobacteriales bacterium]
MMKKPLLALFATITAGLASGQGNVVVQVLSPGSIAGSYSNVYATADNGWAVADLTVPANAVQGELALGVDGTAADSLGCEALVNGEELAGKIAVIYRGTCNFSLKALNAQDAGALAVLLINNSDNMAINMQGGTYGMDVTIPVAMISQTNGAEIRAVMDVEPVNAFIGNNFGAFPNNLSVDGFDFLVPSAAALPRALTANPGEFMVTLGGFVHNFGSATQGPVRLRAVVTQGSTEIYNEVSEVATLNPGDSVFISLPDLSQDTWDGSYQLTYTAESDVADEFAEDNSYSCPMYFGEVLSYVPVDPATSLPNAEMHVVPSGFTGPFRTCIAFQNPNGGRLSVTGMRFSARTPADIVEPNDSALTDRLITTYAFLWTDEISNAYTIPTDGGLTTLDNGSYTYTEDLQSQAVLIPFSSPIALDNSQRYLFCVETQDSIIRQGWNEAVDYAANADYSIEPTSVLKVGPTWYNGFNGVGGGPAISIETVVTSSIGINENDKVELTPYPNPTRDHLRIPMKGFNGGAALRIFSLDGQLVAERKVVVGGDGTLTVDLAGMSAGTYQFHIDFENGQRSDFRVVVAK